MGLRFNTKLLLMTLLQITAKYAELQSTPEADSSVTYGEFCLRISDDSHWTSPEPVAQEPTKPTSPSKQPRLSRQSPTQQTPANPETATQNPQEGVIVTGRANVVLMAPSEMTSEECKCKKTDGKLTSDVSRLTSITVWSPNKTCRRKEFIVTTKGRKKVCVSKSTAKRYIRIMFGKARRQTETGRPLVFPTQRDTNKPQHTTTEPTVAETMQAHDPRHTNFHPSDSIRDFAVLEDIAPLPREIICVSCRYQINLDGVDSTSVSSVDVTVQHHTCPILMSATLKNGTSVCLDSKKELFSTALTRLTFPPPHETDITDGCRCKDKKKELPNKTSSLQKKIIWYPTETCGSFEFIEILSDRGEVCVTVSGLMDYMKAPPPVHEPEVEPEVEIASYIIETEQPELVAEMSTDSADLTEDYYDSSDSCLRCSIKSSDVPDLLNLEDIAAVWVIARSEDCPYLLQIQEKSGGVLCVDSSHSLFMTLLEHLDF